MPSPVLVCYRDLLILPAFIVRVFWLYAKFVHLSGPEMVSVATQTQFWSSTPCPSEAGSFSGEPILGSWQINNAEFTATGELSDTMSDGDEFHEDGVDIGDESYMPSLELTIDKYVVV